MIRRPRRALRFAPLLLAATLTIGLEFGQGSPSSATPPAVALAPAANYHNNQTVTVSLPANSMYKSPAGLALHVVECADPHGLGTKLPTRYYECDADTSTRIISKPDGSFSAQFIVYTTPLQLEPSDSLPKCDATHYCVVMVSQNIANLANAHIFSAPFLVGAVFAPRLVKPLALVSKKDGGTSVVLVIAIAAILVFCGVVGLLLVRRRMERA